MTTEPNDRLQRMETRLAALERHAGFRIEEPNVQRFMASFEDGTAITILAEGTLFKLHDNGMWVKSYEEERNGITRRVMVVGANSLQKLRYASYSPDSKRTSWFYNQNFFMLPGQVLWFEDYTGGNQELWWGLDKPEGWLVKAIEDAREELAFSMPNGPFTPLHPYDLQGYGPAEDWTLSPYPETGMVNGPGLYLMSVVNLMACERSLVFIMTPDGTPRFDSHPEGYWMSQEQVSISGTMRTEAELWAPHQKVYGTYDDEHSARGWRAASLLAEAGCPMAKWVIECWYNRMAMQVADPNRKKFSQDGYLYQSLDQIIEEVEPGKGTRFMSRAGCWSFELACVAQKLGLDKYGIVRKFEQLVRKAANNLNEVHADTRQTYAYHSRVPKGPFPVNTPLSHTHEMAIWAMLLDKRLGWYMGYILQFLPKGKAKVFGRDAYSGKQNGYMELLSGDLSNYDNSYDVFVKVCSSRSLLSSAQPFFFYSSN